MKQMDKWSALGFSALGAMCGVWTYAGWYVLATGGFYSTPRHTKLTTYVDGAASIFMALVFFSLATISSWVILQRLNAPRATSYAAALAILGCPATYLAISAFR